MNFARWIEKTGHRKVAAKLKVDPSTVSLWAARSSLPKPATMKEIVKVSGGRVSYKEIIEPFVNAQN